LAQLVFNSPKGVAFLSHWVILVFGFGCGFLGVMIPYGATGSKVLDRGAWKNAIILGFTAAILFFLLTLLATGVARSVHSATLNITHWIADTIILVIPFATALIILLIGLRMKNVSKEVVSK